jgi:hypothetical protein
LDEPLESAEFDDVKPRLFNVVLLVQEQSDFAVTFDASHRVDDHPPQIFGILCGLEMIVHGSLPKKLPPRGGLQRIKNSMDLIAHFDRMMRWVPNPVKR